MFKKILLILACSTASVSCGIEVAEKHLDDLQKQYQAGMADALEMMQAEADLIQTKAWLDITVSEKEIARMIELRERIYRLTEARYKEGLCPYMKVYEAKLMYIQYTDGLTETTINQLSTEAIRIMEQRAKAGVADALEALETKRFILELQLGLKETTPENRTALIQQIEQNYAEAEQLALARYQAGLLPYDKLSELQEIHATFKDSAEMIKTLDSSADDDEKRNKIRDYDIKYASRQMQRYEILVKQGNASPFTLLHARLDYLYSKKILSQYQEKQ